MDLKNFTTQQLQYIKNCNIEEIEQELKNRNDFNISVNDCFMMKSKDGKTIQLFRVTEVLPKEHKAIGIVIVISINEYVFKYNDQLFSYNTLRSAESITLDNFNQLSDLVYQFDLEEKYNRSIFSRNCCHSLGIEIEESVNNNYFTNRDDY
jgi:hypothetical protein